VNDLRITSALLAVPSLFFLICGVAIAHPVPLLIGGAGMLASLAGVFHARIAEAYRDKALWVLGTLPAVVMVSVALVTGNALLLLVCVPLVAMIVLALLAPKDAPLPLTLSGWRLHAVAIGVLVAITLMPSMQLRLAVFFAATTLGLVLTVGSLLRARRG
jgi:hypothetical protein